MTRPVLLILVTAAILSTGCGKQANQADGAPPPQSPAPRSASKPVPYLELLKTTIKNWDEPGRTLSVWWMPKIELISLCTVTPGGPIPSPDLLDSAYDLSGALDNYALVAVAASRADEDGKLKPVPREELLSSVLLHIQGKEPYPALSEGNIPEEVQTVVSLVKDITGKAFSPDIVAKHWFVFGPIAGQATAPDPTKSGRFSVTANGGTVSYRLPIEEFAQQSRILTDLRRESGTAAPPRNDR